MKNVANIFISYSRRDKKLLDEFRKHLTILERKGIVKIWYDGLIEAGENWENEVKNALSSADIILLLISSDFIASDYCYSIEMSKALELQKKGESKTIPIILRDCLWRDSPFAELQVLPNDGTPVTDISWKSLDKPFFHIIEVIKEIVRKIIDDKKSKIKEDELGKIVSAKKVKFHQLINSGNSYLEDLKWEKAKLEFEKSLIYYSKDFFIDKLEIQEKIDKCNKEIAFEYYFLRGKQKFENGDYDMAMDLFAKAIKIKNHSELILLLESCRRNLNRAKLKFYKNLFRKNYLNILLVISFFVLLFFLPTYYKTNKQLNSEQHQLFYTFQDTSKLGRGLMGVKNATNKVIIKPIYDFVGEYDGAYFPVEKGKKWGFIDTLDRFIVPLMYQKVNLKGFDNTEKTWVILDNYRFFIDKNNTCIEDCPPGISDLIKKNKEQRTKILRNRIGKDHGLIITINDYEKWPNLKNPVRDGRAIGKELELNFGFEIEYLDNPTKEQILSKLIDYSNMEFDEDNQLFVLFSGHGDFNELTNEGFFVPKDGNKKMDIINESQIPLERLGKWVNAFKNDHILLAIDACYSGTINPFGYRGKPPNIGPGKLEEEEQRIAHSLRYKSRFYFTSGGKERTSDGIFHSPFTEAFIDALRSKTNKILAIDEIFTIVNHQSPKTTFGTFGNHERGGFLFIPK